MVGAVQVVMLGIENQRPFPDLQVSRSIEPIQQFSLGAVWPKFERAYAYRYAALTTIAAGALSKLAAAAKAFVDQQAVDARIDLVRRNGDL